MIHEVEQSLALGHETRSFEIKGPGSLNDRGFCAKVARAAMAMGNLRDGGLVCIGIDETRMTVMLPGLDAVELKEWSNFDDVSEALARYSEPPVTFGLHPFRLSSGIDIVVIEVAEFDDVPHVCRRDYPQTLQKGMTYVRPRGKPESVPAPSSTDMRELLDLAITKGVREFIRRAGAAGVSLGAARAAKDVEHEAFASEAQLAWAVSSAVTERIHAAGHTDVQVRPGPFVPDRVSPERLESLLSENTVRLRGWPVPFVDQRTPILRGGTWIGQDIEPDVVPHCEAWRLCTSGQFLQQRILTTDLVTSPELVPHAAGATGSVAVWDVLLYLVEVAELGARFAAAVGCETITIAVSLKGIAGRQLISGDWKRDLPGRYVVNAEHLDADEVTDSTRLIEDPRSVGVKLTQGLLRQFGLDVADQLLLDWQDQIFGGR
jgi:hypothetical protein